MSELTKKIEVLKKERDAVILAHYYVDDEVQAAADYVGDSYYLSQTATKVPQKTIVFCGVKFMGESAKLLNPEKTVLMPDEKADCPMAHMAAKEKIEKVKAEYDDVAVVCYINSTAEIKMYADVCVTSANAMKIVSNLPNKNIYFIPDEHLGRYIAEKLPEKNFIFNDGFCHVHTAITKEKVEQAKKEHPEAEVLVHPECKAEVADLGDYVGSTSGIIKYAGESSSQEFIVCTEPGVLYELKKQNPDKKFYPAGEWSFCTDMKCITLEKVANVMESMENQVELPEEMYQLANKPLEQMLILAK